VAFLLEELGVPYERVLVDLGKGENKTPQYLSIHPHGWVPALVDGDTIIHETAAICLYLADRHIDRGLAPPQASPERGAYYQWIVYSVATLEPCLADVYLQLERPLEQRDEAVLRSGRERFAASAQVLTRALTDGPFLLGEHLSAADVLVGAMLVWAGALGLLHEHPVLQAYAGRIASRPAFGRA
jgi:glutathione S-transferase